MNWYEEKELDSPTLQQFDKLVELLKEQRQVIDEIKSKLKDENETLDKIELRVLSYLKTSGKSSYKSNVGTVGLSERRSWRLPQTPEQKSEFYSYLKEAGHFEALISVNSATLNSYLKAEFEAAARKGTAVEFKIPGIGEPSVMEILSFKKG